MTYQFYVCKRTRLSCRGTCAFFEIDFHRLGVTRRQVWSGLVPVLGASRRQVAGGGCAGASTGNKTDSARQPGPAPRASGRTPVPPRRRWVPPSCLRTHDAPDHDAKHDVIFRKVRGILNKLTPEKFQKLSDDLLGLELDSDKVLKGVILLIFEKALDEPKYSSMYAQLCKRLSEEAPNFEPPGQPCTFKLLLLNKCRTEFENRAQAFAAFEDKALSPEEEEKRHLAKCKMLGNIKFIGELGKLEILAESILHRCIQNLLARRAAAEHHEDLECLAQLVRTCGRVLDSERGRGLMDQYFARIETLAGARELAPRLRFMLRDVAELRRGGWVPRAAAAAAAEGPVPMHQLRPDEPPRRERDALFRRARPLDDVLAGLSLAPPAALVPPTDKLFGNGFARDAFRQRSAPNYYPRHSAHSPAQHYHKHAQTQQPPSGKESRSSKARVYAAAALHDVQMRPAANSLMFTANKLSKPQPTPPLAPVQQNVLAPAFSSAPSLLNKEPAITIKPAVDKKDKLKKDKAHNKEEACRLATEEVDNSTAEGPDEEGPALQRLRELAPNDKVARRAAAAALERALGCDAAHAHRAALRVLRALQRPAAHELRALALQPAPSPRLPALAAAALQRAQLAPADLAAWVDAGAAPALLLDALAALAELAGAERARRLVDDAKLDVAAYAARDGDALAALEARGLTALAPQLRLRAQLQRQLAADPPPHALYRWIKANVEPAVRQNAAFVSALVALVLERVAAPAGDKAALEREKALVEGYAPLLTALLEGRADLQLAAVYAVQVHAHQHRYPKGMLLRWFMYLYNLEVCEEEAFLRWREDVTDAYPGKGEALFQVNTWLTWLQQQESEDEEAED